MSVPAPTAYDLTTAPQRAAIRWALDDSPRSELMIQVGTVRSGKTFGIVNAMALRSINYPGSYILLGTTRGAVQRNIVPYFQETATAWGVPFAQTSDELRFGPSTWYMFGASRKADEAAIQGLTARGAIIDEATLIPESIVWLTVTRCSITPKIAITCNPSNPRHWVKTELIDRADEIGAQVVHSNMTENQFLDDEIKEWFNRLFTGAFAQRMLKGEWTSLTGQVYRSWPQAPAPPTSTPDRSIMGIDYGISNPTAAVVLQLHAETWYTSAEYYWPYAREERTTEDHARALRELDPTVEQWEIDPSAAALRASLARLGIRAHRANNDVVGGIQAVQRGFANHQLVITDNTPQLSASLHAYEWTGREDADRPVKKDDHLPDALRYAATALWTIRAPTLPTRKPSSL